MKENQKVLCALKSHFSGINLPLGFTPDPKLFEQVSEVYKKSGEFLLRSDVEDQEQILQAIVYGIVTDGEKVLGLWRKDRSPKEKRFVETRLNKKLGLACGGHIEPHDDINIPDFFNNAMLREFSEELIFPEIPNPVPVGVIRYEESPIDRVHLGLIYKVFSRPNVTLPKESDEYEEVIFLTPNELEVYLPKMEGWGKAIAEAVFSKKFSLI